MLATIPQDGREIRPRRRPPGARAVRRAAMTDDGAAPLAELLADFQRISRGSVLVLGDASLERRIVGTLDTSDGVLRLGDEEAALGGGAALVGALAAFGVATALISVLGDDLAGAQLTALVGAESNVEPWLLVDGVKATVTETSYVERDGRILFRTIREDVRPMNGKLRERMLRIAGDAMAATTVTVLADRGHGTLDVETATAILARSRQAGRRIVADLEAVDGLEARYRGFDVLVRLAPPGLAAEAAEAALRALRTTAESGAAVLFLPEGALLLIDRDGVAPAVEASVAAGAAVAYRHFLAGFAGALATGRSVRRALQVGAFATRREARP